MSSFCLERDILLPHDGRLQNLQTFRDTSPPNQALPQANTAMTPPIPRTLAMEPNDSVIQPKALMPSMEVAVAIAVYTAMTRPTIPGGATS